MERRIAIQHLKLSGIGDAVAWTAQEHRAGRPRVLGLLKAANSFARSGGLLVVDFVAGTWVVDATADSGRLGQWLARLRAYGVPERAARPEEIEEPVVVAALVPPGVAPMAPPSAPPSAAPSSAPARPRSRPRSRSPRRPAGKYLTDGRGVVYTARLGLMVYVGFATLSYDLRKGELQAGGSECPKWVKLMLAKAVGAALDIKPFFVVRQDDRRGGRMRELLCTVHELRKPGGLWRARGACFCDARTERGAPLGLDRWDEDCRDALKACLHELPAGVDGGEEGALNAALIEQINQLGRRFPCIQRHLDREQAT